MKKRKEDNKTDIARKVDAVFSQRDNQIALYNCQKRIPKQNHYASDCRKSISAK